MSRWLKQSTSVDVPIGPFVDAADGVTAETALTLTQPDIRLKKNGGAWAQKAAAQTLNHEENGWYELTLDATDTNTLGHLVVAVHESGALPVWCEFMVVPANVYDSLVGGSDYLDTEVAAMAANTLTATAVAAGAITAAKFAAGAVDAAALAADAGTEIGTAVWASAARTLTANTNLNDPTAAAIADAVWDEARGGHTTGGSFGEGVASVQGNLTGTINGLTVAALADFFDTNSGTDYASAAAGSVVKEIADNAGGGAGGVTDWTSDERQQIRHRLGIDGTAAAPTATPSLATAAAVDAVDNFVDTEVAAIKAKTDLIPASPAAVGDIPTAAAIADAVWDEDATAHQTQGTFGQAIGDPGADTDTIFGLVNTNLTGPVATAAALAQVQTDTDDIQTRLPAALVSGRIDASVGAVAANALTASALATDAAAEIAAAVLAAGDIDGYTLEEAAKLLLAAAAGKLSGAATTTVAIRAADDSKARITATVDADGNRSAVTLDETG